MGEKKRALFQLKSGQKAGKIKNLRKKTGIFKLCFSLHPCSIYNASGPPSNQIIHHVALGSLVRCDLCGLL